MGLKLDNMHKYYLAVLLFCSISYAGFGQVTLPLDFEDTELTYTFEGFEGADSEIIANPDTTGGNFSNRVMRSTKTNGAQFFAGTVITLDAPIDFSTDKGISIRTWSPKVNIPIRLRLENADNSVGMEIDLRTTRANAWETLTADFGSRLDPSAQYTKIIVFFEFINGLAGDGTTYYFDDIALADVSGRTPVGLPIDFESSELFYDIAGFEGANANLIMNPDATGENTSNMVVEYSKTNGSAFFAGVTVRFDTPIDFSGNKGISFSSWSPKANIPVRVQIAGDTPENIRQVDVNTTVASSWETLTADFSEVLVNGEDYDRVVIFYEFVVDLAGDGSIYYFDNIATADVGGAAVALPVDFENTEATYRFGGFEGADSAIEANPDQTGDNTSATVMRTTKNAGQWFAGTFLDLDTPIDFSTEKGISISSWSPKSDIPVRIQIEDTATPGNNRFVDVNTTVASSWETLTADFTNVAVAGANYDRVTVIFEAIVDLAGDGTTYYYDNIQTADVGGGGGDPVTLPVDFEDPDLNYRFEGFEGAISQIIMNPDPTGENTSSMVMESLKGQGSAFFAGTYIDLDEPIDFSTNKGISISSWSPKANIPVRIQIEAGQGIPAQAVDVMTTTASSWETLTADFTNLIDPNVDYNRVTVIFDFVVDQPGDSTTYYYDNIQVADVSGGGGDPVTLPVDFEDPDLNYRFEGFEGAISQIIMNPDPTGENTSSMVMETLKGQGSQFFAGTFVDLDAPIDFSTGTGISISSWSPKANIPVRIQIEAGEGIPAQAVDVMTTTASSWETLTADFTNLIDPNVDYNRVTVIFDFVVDQPGDSTTYYYDNIQVADVSGGGGDPVTLPVDFEDPDLNYRFEGFEGAISQIIMNPDPTGENTSSMVMETLKGQGSQFFAGTFVDLDAPIDFSTGTGISISSWSPKANIPVRIQIEAGEGIPAQAVDVMTTTASSWETLTADFTNLIDPNVDYNRVTVIFDFVVDQPGDSTTYYYDNIQVADVSGGGGDPVTLPVDFEDPDLNYRFEGFEGAISQIIMNPDPTGENTSSMVMETLKGQGSQFFAGTFVDLDAPIDFSTGTGISISSWSPKANIPVRIQIEAGEGIPAQAVDVMTTTASSWETLTADFTNLIDPNVDYNRVTVIFDFVVDQPGDSTTYYYDNIQVADVSGGGGDPVTLPVDFEDPDLNYRFEGFEGAISQIIMNPDPTGENTSSMVMETLKGQGSAFFAGTFIDLDEPIDFSTNKGISISSWSPKANIPVRIQIEAGEGIPAQAVDVMTTTASSWETLTADFTNLIDPNVDYNRVTVIFDFVVDQPGDSTTYYYDNIQTAEITDENPPVVLPIGFENPNLVYDFRGFEGAQSTIIMNPDPTGENTSSMVMETVKTDGAQFFAGTAIEVDEPINLSNTGKIVFSSWSPKANIPVRIQLEDQANTEAARIFLDVNTTTANAWETLEADFSSLAVANTDYVRVVIFYEFVPELPGDGSTYYFDNISVDELTSTRELTAADVQVFPNPTSSQWQINSPEARIEEVNLFDLSGKLLMAAKPGTNQFEINAQQLPTGTYLLSVVTGEGRRIARLIKQ
jgi:flagellin-like hook-associated protein FlgL